MSPTARLAAAIVAIVCWVGLAVQLQASTALMGSLGGAIVAMLRYFTVIGNLFAACVYSAAALGSRRAATPFVIGGVTLTMLLIGIVYALLLNGLLELSGGAALADLLLHKVTPALAALYWLVIGPKAGLKWRDPLLWALLPLVYFVYALARAGVEGIYAYPFLNVATLGWGQVLLTALAMAIGFLVVGVLLVWIGRLIDPRRRQA